MSNIDIHKVRTHALSMMEGVIHMEGMLEIMRDLEDKSYESNCGPRYASVHVAMKAMAEQISASYYDMWKELAPAKLGSVIDKACPDMETALSQLVCGVELMGTLVYVYNDGGRDLWRESTFTRQIYACQEALTLFLSNVEDQREAMQEAIDALPDELPTSIPKAEKVKKAKANAEQPVPA